MSSLPLKQTFDNQQTYLLCNIFCVQGDLTATTTFPAEASWEVSKEALAFKHYKYLENFPSLVLENIKCAYASPLFTHFRSQIIEGSVRS